MELNSASDGGPRNQNQKLEFPTKPAKRGSSAVFFSAPLAKKLGDFAVKFGGSCKPNSNIWSMVTAMLVDGAGVHEGSAYCRG